MECSNKSTAKSFCEIISVYLPYSCPFCYSIVQKTVPCLLSLSLALPLWLPHSHTSWTFSPLCFAFASAFIKISPYFCCFVSLWFSAFLSFKCSLFLSTGNVRSSSLVSFVIHVQNAVYTGQIQQRLNSSICWKLLCTCHSQWGDENLCHVLGDTFSIQIAWNKMRVLHPHFSSPWVSVRLT